MHCKKTQFTFFERRHHCRNCGLVVCANCSMRKELIQAQSCKPIRVCDTCFTTLSQRRLSGVQGLTTPTQAIPPDFSSKIPVVIVENASNPGYDTVPSRKNDQETSSNGINAKSVDGAETSDSDDDDYNDSSDGLNQAAASLTLEDQKPTFYSEVTDAVEELLEGAKETKETEPSSGSNGTNISPSTTEPIVS